MPQQVTTSPSENLAVFFNTAGAVLSGLETAARNKREAEENFRRLTAKIDAEFGDLFGVLKTLPTKGGKKFYVEINEDKERGNAAHPCAAVQVLYGSDRALHREFMRGVKGVYEAFFTPNGGLEGILERAENRPKPVVHLEFSHQDGGALTCATVPGMHVGLPLKYCARQEATLAGAWQELAGALAKAAPGRVEELNKKLSARTFKRSAAAAGPAR